VSGVLIFFRRAGKNILKLLTLLLIFKVFVNASHFFLGGAGTLFCKHWFVGWLPDKSGQVVRLANEEHS